ncbi:MAG: PAS domain-containing protein [Coleofasciculaceae cyanobacterium SM2_3_26]|nr:PAS domain-containing protein [Coleofasciculaceae cyanobacterium SM2_3_26]
MSSERPPVASASESLSHLPGDSSPYRVLYVEGDRGAAASIQDLLAAKQQITLTWVASLAEAEKNLCFQGFDVLLVALCLPDSDPEATLNWVRDRSLLYPVVVLTAATEENLEDRAFEAGAQEFLSKHQNGSSELVHFLRHAVARHRAQVARHANHQNPNHQNANQESCDRLHLFESAFNAANEGIVITDASPNRGILYVNRAFETMTGYSKQEVLGKNCRFLQGDAAAREQQSPSDRLGLEKLRRALREERGCCVVLCNYRKDGTLFWNKLSISPVRDVSGQVTHYVGIQSEITEVRSLTENLSRQLSRTELLRQISEEIRASLDPQEVFQTAAVKIGNLLQVDRCLIHSYIPEPEPRVPIAGQFIAPGYSSVDAAKIPIQGNPHVQQLLASDRAIASPDVYADPFLIPAVSICQQLQIKSMLAVRTSYKGKPNGVIGLHQCSHYRTWTEEEIDFIESVAVQLGIAIAQASLLETEKRHLTELACQNQQLRQEIWERQQMEVQLRCSEDRWQLALKGNNDGVWDWDLITNEIFHSPPLERNPGLQRGR